MRIRKVRKKDLEEIVELEEVSFKKPWNLSRLKAQYQENREGFLVAEEHGKMLGFSLTKPSGLLMLIAVRPEYQGRGVGSRLLEESLKFLKDRGAARAFVHVRKSNQPVMYFYLKNGFRKEKLLRGYYSDEDGWLLTKQL